MNPGATHAQAIPDEVVEQYVIAGRPEECVEQVESLFAAGVDEITIRPYAVDGGSRRAMIEAFARDVMHPCRARSAAVL
jgi:5,10-methylenetetrahydromethanopterin reductase